MDTFLSLERGGKALDFPPGRVPCPFLGLEGEGRGAVDVVVWEGSGRRGGGGNIVFYFIKNNKKIVSEKSKGKDSQILPRQGNAVLNIFCL